MSAGGGVAPPPPRGARPRRDPVPIVLVLVLVAAGLVGVVFAAFHPDVACECPEVGNAWVNTTPASVSHGPTGYAYAFKITQVVNPPEVYGDFSYWFSTALGAAVAPGPTWTLTVNSSTGNFTAGFVPGSQVLNLGGSVTVATGAVVTIFTGTANLAGGRILLDANANGDASGLSTVVVS